MSDPNVALERYARDFAAALYPPIEELRSANGFRRKWIVRVAKELPTKDVFEAAIRAVEQEARRIVDEAIGKVEGDDLRPQSSVSAIRLSDHHVVLHIDSARSPSSLGDEPLVVTSCALHEVDRLWEVEDVQGLPKQYWSLMRIR